MNAHVWTKMALASALLVGGIGAQAQTSSGGVGTAGQGAVGQQTRPAPITGKVSTDPAAVALRPAAQAPAPVTSKATQVAPPANPNEPLFSPATEASARTTAATPTAAPKPAESAAQRQPHRDRTEGVKKLRKTSPQPHDKKVSGKPRQTAKGAGKDAAKDEAGKGSKDAGKGKKKSGKQAGAASTVKGAHGGKADAGKKTSMSSVSHQASHLRGASKSRDRAGNKVAVAHSAKAGKRAADNAGRKPATKLTPSAVAGKADGKAAKKIAQQPSLKRVPKVHHAKAGHTTSRKLPHNRQTVAARSASAKASAPLAKKPAKTARVHKAAA